VNIFQSFLWPASGAHSRDPSALPTYALNLWQSVGRNRFIAPLRDRVSTVDLPGTDRPAQCAALIAPYVLPSAGGGDDGPSTAPHPIVMAGLVPAIRVFLA
jgi:hypothetical protein